QDLGAYRGIQECVKIPVFIRDRDIQTRCKFRIWVTEKSPVIRRDLPIVVDIGIFEPARRSILLRRGFIYVGPALEQPNDLIPIELTERMAGLYPRSDRLRPLRLIVIQCTGGK